jgi:hypothetical protein
MMDSRRYSFMVAIIFLVLAALQLARAVLGWPVAVTTPWGTLMIPLWPNWVACGVMLLMAWLGFRASRS